MDKEASDIERIGMEIYWAAYDQYINPDHKHPHKHFTMEVAWGKASEVQRRFCRHQARRAIAAMAEERHG